MHSCDNRVRLLGVGAALLVALATRLPYFTASDFPLNDGGMFAAMTADLMNARFALPLVTTYNLEGIPYAYPPLSFYLVGITSGVTGLSPITLARYVPLLANLGTVVAVAVLSWSLLRRGWEVVAAPVIFALLPRGYEWMIMGGGLTRAIGLLLAIACLGQARRLYATPTPRRLLVCAVLTALALAAHLEEGIFALYSLVLLMLCYQRRFQAAATCGVLGGAAFVLTAPWWGTVISQHGLAPFQAASQTGGFTSLREEAMAFEGFLTPPRILLSIPGALALLGVIVSLLRKELFLPLWLPLTFVLSPRSAPSEAVVPLAMLAAIGLVEVVGPGLASVAAQAGPYPLAAAFRRRFIGSWRSSGVKILAITSCASVVLSALFVVWPRIQPNHHTLESISAADRQVMQWITENTPATSTFLVLSPSVSWEEDHIGEWFPVLAERRSLLTPQGAEWMPAQLHARTACLFSDVRAVGSTGQGVDTLEGWARDRSVGFSHIYVSEVVGGPIDWTSLVESARASSVYSVGLELNNAAVIERVQPVAPRWPASAELSVSPLDCASLADQSVEVQASFTSLYGGRAADAWVQEHRLALPQRPSTCRLLSQIGMSGLSC